MKKIIQGFSLLELLLVLSIIAVMMVAGIRLSDQHVLRVKVENTVLQMESLLGYAQQFYANNGRWPGMGDMDPQQLNHCPWSRGQSIGSCYSVGQTSNPSTFVLRLNIPRMSANAYVGSMIKARLPNVIFIDNDPYTVQTSVPIPGLIVPSESVQNKVSYTPTPTPAGVLVGVFQTYSAGTSRDTDAHNPPLTLVDCPTSTNIKEVFFIIPQFNNTLSLVGDGSQQHGPLSQVVGACAAYDHAAWNEQSLCDFDFNGNPPEQAPCYLPTINNGSLANPMMVQPGESNTIYPYACSVQPVKAETGQWVYSVHALVQPFLALEYCVPA